MGKHLLLCCWLPKVIIKSWVVIMLLASGRASAWSVWPFGTISIFGKPASGPALPSAVQIDEEVTNTPSTTVRLCKFQAPFETSKLNRIIRQKDASESTCRYALAKRLVDDVESCSSESSLGSFARIATICHYQASDRDDLLPNPCRDNGCVSRMSSEAFQVYTAFHMHAEKICREINSRMWMESIEGMVESLASVGDRAIEEIQQVQQQNQVFFTTQIAQAGVLEKKLDTVRDKQEEHLRLESEHMEKTMESMIVQQVQMEVLQSNLSQLQTALSSFDSIVAILMDIRAAQQSMTFASLAQATGFYLCFLVTLRALPSLIESSDHLRINVRRVLALLLLSSLITEWMVAFLVSSGPSSLMGMDVTSNYNDGNWGLRSALRTIVNAIDDKLVWTMRYCHLLGALFISAVLIALNLARPCVSMIHGCVGTSKADFPSFEDGCSIETVLWEEIVRLRSIKYLPTNSSGVSEEFQRLLEEPPPGYRRASARSDGLPLDESLYASPRQRNGNRRGRSISFLNSSSSPCSSTSSISVSMSEEDFLDERYALDAPHCIAACE